MAKTAPKTLKTPKAKPTAEPDALTKMLHEQVGHYLYPTVEEFAGSFDNKNAKASGKTDLEWWMAISRIWLMYKLKSTDPFLPHRQIKKIIGHLEQRHIKCNLKGPRLVTKAVEQELAAYAAWIHNHVDNLSYNHRTR